MPEGSFSREEVIDGVRAATIRRNAMTRAASGMEECFGAFDYEHATVGDAMRQEVIYCPPEAPLRTVAQIMVQDRIHCVVVGAGQGWGVVSDRDLLRAAEGGIDGVSAGEVAASDLPTVTVDDPLDRARELLVEHEVGHALVVDPGSGRPVGVLSTLDLVGVLAVGRS
jgi:CBS domain-containing protein